MPDNTPEPANDTSNERRPSGAPLGVLFLYFICFVLASLSHMLSVVLISALLLATIWFTFSKKQYEQLRKGYPNYPRGDYIWNNLIQHILIPWAIIFIIAGIAYIFKS